jgi:hypothetical protein
MSLEILLSCLKAPSTASRLNTYGWNQVLLYGHRTGLLGQLTEHLEAAGINSGIPAPVRRAMDLELLTCQRRGNAALWELSTMRRAIPENIPLYVLKGCAYILANDRNHTGRRFSDIDLLVPENHIQRAEASLVIAGWKPTSVSDYDQRYYREWMHEIPPMTHVRRQTALDLHHAIIPKVSCFSFPIETMLSRATEVSSGVFTLDPLDRIIHCAVHAFLEGVAEKALRDLYDLHCLTRQHCTPDSQRAELLSRVDQLGLGKLVIPALAAAEDIFSDTQRLFRTDARATLLSRAATTTFSSSRITAGIYSTGLLLHSHWAKMPPSLLVKHYLHKAITGMYARKQMEIAQ